MSSTFVHRFGEFELDLTSGRLFRGNARVPLSNTQTSILVCLITRAGQLVSKDTLAEAGWRGDAVTDVTVAQTVSRLRKALGSARSGAFIETVPSRGYRFTASLTRAERHDSRALAHSDFGSYRAFMHGRAGLHTLNRKAIGQARVLFDEALRLDRNYVHAHIGLANACALMFEATRIDAECDEESLLRAVHHARRATALAPTSGDAWSTLAFALYLSGETEESGEAAHRAIALEPDNWLHWLRLAFVSWGEDRIRAARSMLALCPGLALGHWLIATVLIARGAFDAALDVLGDGCAAQDAQSAAPGSFPAVGLHLLRGLVLAAQQRLEPAADALTRELSSADEGQLYARECVANTWYALGAVRLRQRRHAEADQAFASALRVAPAHVFTLAALGQLPLSVPPSTTHDSRLTIALDAELGRAVGLTRAGRHLDAAQVYRTAVTDAAIPNAGWILPVEPLIDPGSRPDVWADVVTMVRRRAV